MSKKEKKPYYIEPSVFKASLRKYYDSDILTDDLAENIKKIAYGLSYNASFINYTYKDDMIGDALIKMYSALKYKKFSFDKATNPFSYFTTIAYHAFVNRIKKEKRYRETIDNYQQEYYAAQLGSEDGPDIYVTPDALENELGQNG